MKRLRVQLAIALGLSLLGSINMNAQTIKDRALDARQQNIVMISGLTATGDLEHLRTALNSGLDGGLTVNEIKDVLVQMYAYCGFPRSLNGINTFMTVLQERKQRGARMWRGKPRRRLLTAVINTSGAEKLWRRSRGSRNPDPPKALANFLRLLIAI